MVKTQRVVITPGEPAGIGPDLVVQLAQREWPVELVVCADATLLTDNADAVLAMYHDQGLPVLKYQGFGRGVNITLGLPFIRTSVDHGTALELAGRGKADVGSFITALNLAIKMIVNTQ